MHAILLWLVIEFARYSINPTSACLPGLERALFLKDVDLKVCAEVSQ